MSRILIFGNSGSGKTTMAVRLADKLGIPHFELDLITWSRPGVRREFDDSLEELINFIESNERWVIEGCYGDLVQEASFYCTELRFLNPGIKECVRNNLARPWESQKYDSEEAQGRYLEYLLDWTRGYDSRDDECSLVQHTKIYNSFRGQKKRYPTT